jgi:magnesium chelatase subunit D
MGGEVSGRVGVAAISRLLPTFPPHSDFVAGRRRSRRRERYSTTARGRYIRAKPAERQPVDLAIDATLRTAAPNQHGRDAHNQAMVIHWSDLQRKVRVARRPNLVLFVVDASWSMLASKRMAAAKGAVLALLTEAYQRRDRVGLITFQGRSATLRLAPTTSVALARRALAGIEVGGKTPLPAALGLARDVFVRARRRVDALRPILVLLTDGIANVGSGSEPPATEAARLADELRRDRIAALVIDAAHAQTDGGMAQGLARRLGAPAVLLKELEPRLLYRTVRDVLKAAERQATRGGLR